MLSNKKNALGNSKIGTPFLLSQKLRQFRCSGDFGR